MTKMNEILDKSSPIPLYHQLARWLESRIADKTFEVGSKLPSETRLAADFKLNRNTVRHAISYLVQKGLVERQRGVGTYVRRGSSLVPVHNLGRLTSFIDDFEINDVELEDVLLSKGVVKASDEVADKLHVSVGDRVVKIERLRIADKTPFVFEQQYYNYEEFADLLAMDIRGSMYRILVDTFEAELHHSIQTLRAVLPIARIAKQLRIPRTLPCMFLESVAYTSTDQPLELLRAFYRGDRYLFQVESSQYRRDMSSIQKKNPYR
jgi:GntR family transcriptional regulator